MVLVLCELLSVCSRFWTRVAESIAHDDNHYPSIISIGKEYLEQCYCLQKMIVKK